MEERGDPERWNVVLLLCAIALVAVAFAGIVPTVRDFDAPFNYDEATYVEWSRHVESSSYYPDKLFLRHPPVYPLALGAWSVFTGEDEAGVRFFSALASIASVVLVALTVRRTNPAPGPAVAALVLVASYLFHAYGTQATMYPLATFWISLGIWAGASKRPRLEAVSVTLAALTHLFGFAFVAASLYRHRRDVWTRVAWHSPALAWLAVAIAAGLLLDHPAGPSWGPSWQGGRFFAVFYEAYVDPSSVFGHFAVVALTFVALLPSAAARLWVDRKKWRPFSIGSFLLVPLLVFGPSFLRYGLLLLPLVVAAGFAHWRPAKTGALFAATICTLGAGLFAAELKTSEVDPGFANDLMGEYDWARAADQLARWKPDIVYSPAPTALSFYLERHGLSVEDASKGPGALSLNGSFPVQVRELAKPAHLSNETEAPTIWLVPRHWGYWDSMGTRGLAWCTGFGGLEVWADRLASCGQG